MRNKKSSEVFTRKKAFSVHEMEMGFYIEWPKGIHLLFYLMAREK